MSSAEQFFEFAAEVGLTKHLGGLVSTDDLIALCHIDETSYVLDVGCGAGATACYLAKRFGCRVVGVDISDMMVARSWERAERDKVAQVTEFRVADAQDLPFDDGLFDAVITESVTAFPEDKPLAVREYARVTKPGGYVGLNESTWRKVPPPPEIVAWAGQDLGASVEPLTAEEWVGLLESAGLTDVVSRPAAVDARAEAKGLVKRYGWGGMARVFSRIVRLYLRNPAYREFLRSVRSQGVIPDNIEEFFGYGLYVGRKPLGSTQ